MSTHELDCAVARHTGESLRTVRRRGFSLVKPSRSPDGDTEPQTLPQMVDWDEVDRDRRSAT